MKKRGVRGREVRTTSGGKTIKMALQKNNERELMIYTEQMLYLQKLIFNIRVQRQVGNVTDMMFNWASILG